MSGTKTSRADLKNRFKKGMYPTEGDFANVFESYLHKDDDISMSKVVLTDGDGNTTTLNNVIGNKADKTDLTEITNRLTTAENDIDTAEDNIAGHETRIQSLEAFKERVRAFLEDADASEETINHWHEIESFLQGITDTQTLTGLLNDLKQEILQSIPQSQQGNYLKLVPDLDAHTDAPVGTIVKYTGPTNNKYTHGFDYEKVGGEPQVTIDLHTPYKHALIADSDFCSAIGMADLQMKKYYPTGNSVNFTRFITTDNNISLYAPPATDTTSVGAVLFSTNFDSNGVAATYTISRVDGDFTYISVNGQDKAIRVNPDGSNSIFYSFAEYIAQDGGKLYINDSSSTKKDVFVKPADGSFVFGNTYARCENATEDIAFSIAGPASWQPSKSMSVID